MPILAQDDPDRLHAEDWYVADVDQKAARLMIKQYHYAHGAGPVLIFAHGLFRKSDNRLMGVAVWGTTSPRACRTVDKSDWHRVITLARLVCVPDAPRNAATFLMTASMRLIWIDGRYTSMVTYADEGQGHTGAIYKASNWTYAGRTESTIAYADPAHGNRMVGRRIGGRCLNMGQMKQLGYECLGRTHKLKFIMHMPKKYVKMHSHDNINSLFEANNEND